jgi:hypothetical protein
VVGIFPDDRSLIRLVGMLCIEQNDEWLVGRRYLSAAATPPPKTRRSESSHQPEQLTTTDEGERQLLHLLGLDWQRVARRLVFLAANVGTLAPPPRRSNAAYRNSAESSPDDRSVSRFGRIRPRSAP